MRSCPTFRLLTALAYSLLFLLILNSNSVVGHADDGQSSSFLFDKPSSNLDERDTNLTFDMPGTQPHALEDNIANSWQCSTCHTAPIYESWRGSMMGQAGRDPLFWAALAVAETDLPGSGEFCLRCHTPSGWLAGRSHASNGSALTSGDIDDGVTCALCHRMIDPKPSINDQAVAIDAAVRSTLTSTVPVERIGSGMFIVDPLDNRRGPFSLNPPHPRQTLRTDFLGQNVDSITESRLCGTCHNIHNPALVWTKEPPDDAPPQFWLRSREPGEIDLPEAELYPIESTYDEWLLSDYPNGVYAPQFAGAQADGMVESCQDCHMPRMTGQAAAGGIDRDCQSNGCLPAHTLVGGNTWIPELLQDERWRLHAADDAAQLNATRTAAQQMLRRSATLKATLTISEGETIATVRVINETGHKLPTGYTEGRRLWLNLRAYDAEGSLIYESGKYDHDDGDLILDSAVRVYEVKPGLTPALAAEAGLQEGPSFHFALNNTVYKDNRIPPRGYTVANFDRPGLRPVDAQYADGQYWDDVRYSVPSTTERIAVTLYYQTASKAYIDFLREKGGQDGAVLGQLWDDNKSPPAEIASISIANHRAYLPLLAN